MVLQLSCSAKIIDESVHKFALEKNHSETKLGNCTLGEVSFIPVTICWFIYLYVEDNLLNVVFTLKMKACRG